ncbi:MAG TPA: GNAT family N-acetyltransferase [Longimicrobiales bacterium]
MSAYICQRHSDASQFLERARPWLVGNEAENNLILGVAAQLERSWAANPGAYLATIEHDGAVTGCAFRTPPYKLGVTRMPLGAARALAEDVVTAFDDAPSVLGNEAVASAVASHVAEARGLSVEPGMRQCIYELKQVVMPERHAPGKLRLGQPGDAELFAQWLIEFAAETGHGPADLRSYTQAHIANKTLFLWDDHGPKTCAVWAGTTPHGVRIGFVYTPPEFRARGYASACVAAASQRALDSGYGFCCLYTDAGNPTSNSIYQKIGYQLVCEVLDYNVT